MKLLFALIVAIITVAPLWAAAPPENGGTESLGNKLLDDLAPAAPQPVTRPEQPGARGAAQPTEAAAPASPVEAKLAEVRSGMQRAQVLLSQPPVPTREGTVQLAGAVQADVVAELDKLIAELSKQCQCQGGGSKPPQQSSKRSQPKPGKPSLAAGRGQAAARDSSDRLGSTAAEAAEKVDVNELVKQLWGHLPERSREQMMQSFSSDFLPKYQLETEQYYRRLSEEQGEQSAK